jgi:hypothetical protein
MRTLAACLLVGASVVGAGCSSLAPKTDPSRPTPLMKERDARMSAVEMRQRVDALVPSMLAFVEEMADLVRAEATNPAVRRRALLLKIDALPVVYRAAFQTDPLAAALDLWLLSYQLENCLEEGTGPCDFGPQQRSRARRHGPCARSWISCSRGSARIPGPTPGTVSSCARRRVDTPWRTRARSGAAVP